MNGSPERTLADRVIGHLRNIADGHDAQTTRPDQRAVAAYLLAQLTY